MYNSDTSAVETRKNMSSVESYVLSGYFENDTTKSSREQIVLLNQ